MVHFNNVGRLGFMFFLPPAKLVLSSLAQLRFKIHVMAIDANSINCTCRCLSNGQWYSFNDQTVSPITRADIDKVYGGSGTRGLFSTTYTSSTNAYMLMYRKIDPEVNAGNV